jgi:hypothetical protein
LSVFYLCPETLLEVEFKGGGIKMGKGEKQLMSPHVETCS